ncbi:MAG: thermonuclease family protein [Candidatus Roizmanbacteria bacterium]
MNRLKKRVITYGIFFSFIFILSILSKYNVPYVKDLFISISPTVPVNTHQVLSASSVNRELAHVKRVIDGDTIELDNGEKVRYIGMNAPEIQHGKNKAECYGNEATQKNKELVEGKTIKMEKDISERDKFGRLLRYVYLPNDASPSSVLFINAYLVEQGYARAKAFKPDLTYIPYIKSVETIAKEKNIGLWSNCTSN